MTWGGGKIHLHLRMHKDLGEPKMITQNSKHGAGARETGAAVYKQQGNLRQGQSPAGLRREVEAALSLLLEEAGAHCRKAGQVHPEPGAGRSLPARPSHLTPPTSKPHQGPPHLQSYSPAPLGRTSLSKNRGIKRAESRDRQPVLCLRGGQRPVTT